jgi:hypothetical protein
LPVCDSGTVHEAEVGSVVAMHYLYIKIVRNLFYYRADMVI